MSTTRELQTGIGRFEVQPWPGDNRVLVPPVTTVQRMGPESTYSWDPLMEAALRAAVAIEAAQVRLLVPGGFRILPDKALAGVLARLEELAGPPPDAHEAPPVTADDRTNALACLDLLADVMSPAPALVHAVQTGREVCAVRDGLPRWDAALARAACAAPDASPHSHTDDLLAALTVARTARAHRAAAAARDLALAHAPALFPSSQNPSAALHRWWAKRPPVEYR